MHTETVIAPIITNSTACQFLYTYIRMYITLVTVVKMNGHGLWKLTKENKGKFVLAIHYTAQAVLPKNKVEVSTHAKYNIHSNRNHI